MLINKEFNARTTNSCIKQVSLTKAITKTTNSTDYVVLRGVALEHCDCPNVYLTNLCITNFSRLSRNPFVKIQTYIYILLFGC